MIIQAFILLCCLGLIVYEITNIPILNNEENENEITNLI